MMIIKWLKMKVMGLKFIIILIKVSKTKSKQTSSTALLHSTLINLMVKFKIAKNFR